MRFSAAADGRRYVFPQSGFIVGYVSSVGTAFVLSNDPTATIANTITAPGDVLSFDENTAAFPGIARGFMGSIRIPISAGEARYVSAGGVANITLFFELS